jgi:dienelactone hydrolase
MNGNRINIPAADGVADSYLVHPAGEPRGGVLYFIDAFGLRPVTIEMAGPDRRRGLRDAGADRSMSAEQIATLEGALDAAGAGYVAEVYPGAGHGYTMADTPVFDEAARERHYGALFALLERHFPTAV